MSYLKQNLIAFDQMVNTLFRGWADETLSARCYRKRNNGRGWLFTYRAINLLFFSQDDHCKRSYDHEQERLQLPPEYRIIEEILP